MIPFFAKSRTGRIRTLVLLTILIVIACLRPAQFYFLITRPLILYSYCRYQPQEGDVVFQSLPRCDLVDAIEGITQSPYSHCGVVLRNDKNQWVVIESIFNVHRTPLLTWMLHSRNGEFVAYRLDPKFSNEIPAFKKKLLDYRGRPYDYNYDMAHEQAVYCSDLVYLAFKKVSGEKLGTLEKLGDLNWKPYEQFIKTEQAGGLPLDRVMITPASLARAPQLHQVYP